MPASNHPAYALASNLGGLTGLLVLLNQIWGVAPVERTLVTAFGAGLAVYLVLAFGYVGVRYIAALAPPQEAEDAASDEAPDALPDAEEGTASEPAYASS